MSRSLYVTHFVRLPPETGAAAFDAVAASLPVIDQRRKGRFSVVGIANGRLELSEPRVLSGHPALRIASGILRPGPHRQPLRAELELLPYHGVWSRLGLQVRTRWLPPRMSHLRVAREAHNGLETAMEAWLGSWLIGVDVELAET